MSSKVLVRDSNSLEIKSILIKDGGLTVGRNPESDIVRGEMKVSRHHATFEYRKRFGIGILTVRDCGSMHGTFVNGCRVRSKVLFEGDIVRIGKYELYVASGSSKPLELRPR